MCAFHYFVMSRIQYSYIKIDGEILKVHRDINHSVPL